LEAEKKAAEEAKKRARKGGFLGLIPTGNADDTEGSIEVSFAGLFKLMCCTHEKPVDERQQLLRIADSLEKVTKRLDCIERQLDIPVAGRRVSTAAGSAASPRHRETIEEKNENETNENKDDDDDDDDESSTGEFDLERSKSSLNLSLELSFD